MAKGIIATTRRNIRRLCNKNRLLEYDLCQRKACLVFIIATLLLYMTCLSVAAVDDASRLVPARTEVESLRVVIDNRFPPYSFYDEEGNLQGISVDLWRRFEELTGIEVELVGLDWGLAKSEMLEGRADVIDTIFRTPEREEIYDFTAPYARIDVHIYFDGDIPGIIDLESVREFTVAAKSADTSVKVLRNAGVLNLSMFDSHEEIVEAAKSGKISVFVMDAPPAAYYLHKFGIAYRFRKTESLYYGEFHRAVRQGDAAVYRAVRNGFAKITHREKKIIEDRWFGISEPEFDWSPFLLPMLVTSFVGIALLLWIWLLRQTVRKKTTDLVMNNSKLAKSESHIRGLIEAMPDLYFVLKNDGTFVEFHGPPDAPLLASPDEFIGKTIFDVFPLAQANFINYAIERIILGERMQTIEYEMVLQGVLRHYEARMATVAGGEIVAIVRDISERKDSEMTLLRMSTHDALTGLYNRFYFERSMTLISQEAIDKIGVVACDLDGLKLINDTFGHERGDNYLKSVAKHLSSVFPEKAVIARIGGDEFAILLPDIEEEEFMLAISKLNNELTDVLSNTIGMPVSISSGAIYRSGKAIDLPDMLLEADRRMYRQKLHRKSSIRHEMIITLRKMLEARDFITDGHAERMGKLAVRLAEKAGLPAELIPDIWLLAQFHDIGKIGTPDHVLFKPGKLNAAEMEIMKRHTEIGYHIALSSVDLIPIADWVLKHHERWDGEGYPLKLAGTDIPLPCRILAVVDAFDAMTNDRPYSKARSMDEALNELARCSGTQFDPELVAAFNEVLIKEAI